MMLMKTKQSLVGCLMFACGALVATLAYARPRQAVEHAPTVAQCQADQRLWMSKLEVPNGGGLLDIPYDTLMAWVHEMGDCEEVDPDWGDKYRNVAHETIARMAARFRDFVWRHNLYDQFIQEDAAGKR